MPRWCATLWTRCKMIAMLAIVSGLRNRNPNIFHSNSIKLSLENHLPRPLWFQNSSNSNSQLYPNKWKLYMVINTDPIFHFLHSTIPLLGCINSIYASYTLWWLNQLLKMAIFNGKHPLFQWPCSTANCNKSPTTINNYPFPTAIEWHHQRVSIYLELWRTSPAIAMTQGQVAQGLRVLQQICLLAFFAVATGSGYPVQHISTSVLFISWLVVQLPLWKLWIRPLGWWLFSTYGKIKVMFQSPPTRISPHPHSHHFSS